MRDVVADRVSEDVVEGVGLGDVAAHFADDGDELAFVVEPFAFLGQGVDRDRVGGAGERCDGLVL